MTSSAPVSVVVLTFNEERNIAACLDSVSGWTQGLFVVDSGSTDATESLAVARGAVVVQHPFETHARQWQWALSSLPLQTEWVLALDADQRVTTELRDAIIDVLSGGTNACGLFVARRQVYRGTWIRHGGYYPKYLLKLFRRDQVRTDEGDLVDHHFVVAGPVRKLRGDLIEDNQNEAAIQMWTAKHNRYAVLQARQEFRQDGPAVGLRALFGPPDVRTQLLKRVWSGLPLFVRPCVYVFYRYILRLGFLDGKQGFIFHVLHAFWYRLLVDINIDELRAQSAGSTERVVRSTTTGPGQEPGAEPQAR
jgi:glycosyltransferase involved in cell wall biosynthesis